VNAAALLPVSCAAAMQNVIALVQLFDLMHIFADGSAHVYNTLTRASLVF